MTAVPHSRGMSRRLVIAYGLPGFVASVPIIPIAILLPSYYAQDLGVGFTLTGIALGVARLLDFFTDIVIGLAVDRFAWQRRGKSTLRYKPWLLIGALVAAVGLYALSHPDGLADARRTSIYLGIWSCVLFLGWTCLMVPYLSWGAILAHDQHDRSRLTIARETAGLFGMLTTLTAPLLILNSDISPLVIITWITLAAGVPLIAACLLQVPDSVAAHPLPTPAKITSRDLLELIKFKPYRTTLVCWGLNSFANGLPAVLFPIVVQKYFMFGERPLFILLFVYFAAGILAAPLWLKMAKRFGKVFSWQTSIVLNVCVFTLVLALDPAGDGLFSRELFYWICAFSGFSLAADMALPASIQADVMEYDRTAHGKQRTATAFALWSMATKLALAAAVLVGFLSLGSSGEQFNAQESSARYLLLFLYVVVPVTTKFGVIYLLRKLNRDARHWRIGDASAHS